MADVTAIEPEEAQLDERLKLLFVCAHPAIDEKIRTPLMLQTVLGLASEQIAKAFLVNPATMAQLLVRAKKKIKPADIKIQNIKISRGEENTFIWCFFLAIVQLAMDGRDRCL